MTTEGTDFSGLEGSNQLIRSMNGKNLIIVIVLVVFRIAIREILEAAKGQTEFWSMSLIVRKNLGDILKLV